MRILVGALLAGLATGCSLAAIRHDAADSDFFPLTPKSQWEYVVSRRGGTETSRFLATVRADAFRTADGRSCPIVDERYGGDTERFPVVYCVENGFLHRVMSLEYKGETLEDNGMRSGEVKFLPVDLRHVGDWEGTTNAYRLPDGSGYEVQQLHHAFPDLQRVIVPAGTFPHCIRVETTAIHSAVAEDGAQTGPRVVLYYSDWYAPGVGLVRTEQRDADAQLMTTIELVHYAVPRGEHP